MNQPEIELLDQTSSESIVDDKIVEENNYTQSHKQQVKSKEHIIISSKTIYHVTVFIVLFILFFGCLLSFVSFKKNAHTLYKLMLAGVIIIFVLLVTIVTKLIIHIPFIQTQLHNSTILFKIMNYLYKNYDPSTFVFETPNVREEIRRNHLATDTTKVNTSFIHTLNASYQQFIHSNSKNIYLFTMLACCISICISFLITYIVIQQYPYFTERYIQPFVITILLLGLFIIFSILLNKVFEFCVVLIHSISFIFYKRIVSIISITPILILLILSTILVNSHINFTGSVLILYYLSILLWTITISLIFIFMYYIISPIIHSLQVPKTFFKSLKNIILDTVKRNKLLIICLIILSVIIFICTFGITCGFIVKVINFNVPNSFLSLENEDTIKVVNVPVINKDLSQITFGCNKTLYYKKEYEHPTIVTPTVNLSTYFELPISTQDYYKITSETLPMNGIVIYPDDIFEQNKMYSVGIILSQSLTNLDSSEKGYKYLQETFAVNDIIGISLDHSFLDTDKNGEWITLKNTSKTQFETYLDMRAILTLNTINYLCDSLNSYFNDKIDMNSIGIVGDRNGGSVALKVIDIINENIDYQLSYIDSNQHEFNIKSISTLATTNQYVPKTLNLISSYFIETIPSLPQYTTPFLYSYAKQSSNSIQTQFNYSGVLYIQRGLEDYLNTGYELPSNEIILDSIIPQTTYYMTSEELTYTVSLFVGSHFLCSLNNECYNYLMLKDFQIADEVLSTSSAFFNNFYSNTDYIIDQNSRVSPNISFTINSNHNGYFYQNAYQQLHRNIKCSNKCSIAYNFSETIQKYGISFSFYQETSSSSYVNMISYGYNNTFTDLSKFRYIGITEHSPNYIGDLHILQTFSFNFTEEGTIQNIDSISLLFDGEILLDDVILY